MNGSRQNIQWFPGHMAKALRSIGTELKNVDLVIELLDARIPKSSKNPELARLSAGKPSVLLLNKSDLADPGVTGRWLDYYRVRGYGAAAVDSKEKKTRAVTADAVGAALREKIGSLRERGQPGYRPRVMVVGIPNVGKSTFINLMAQKAAAAVADKPGVTRGKQWISAGGMDLLDMPGVLWPKFESRNIAENLAFTGAIRDDVLDVTELAEGLLHELKSAYRDLLRRRYQIDGEPPEEDRLLLELIAKKRGMLRKKGEYDLPRAAIMLLDELRSKKLGRISLERPED